MIEFLLIYSFVLGMVAALYLLGFLIAKALGA